MRLRKSLRIVVLSCFVVAWTYPVSAFSTRSEVTDQKGNIIERDSHSWNVFLEWDARISDALYEPVHELALHRIFGCEENGILCSSPKKPHNFAPDSMIVGTRWNDRPVFQIESLSFFDCIGRTIWLPKDAACWVRIFENSERKAIRDDPLDIASGLGLLNRFHFGDMQFLHAMATNEKESARETKMKIMAWAELTYKLATGEIDREVELRKTGIPFIDELFSKDPWTSQQLFTGDDSPYRKDQYFKDFIFGSLVHTVVDSFSVSHVRRNRPAGDQCGNIPGRPSAGKDY